MIVFRNIFENIEKKYNCNIIRHYTGYVNFITVIIENDRFRLNHQFDIDEFGEILLSNIQNSNDEDMQSVNKTMDMLLIFYADHDYQYAYMKPMIINDNERVKLVCDRYNWTEDTTIKQKLFDSYDYGLKCLKFSRKDNFYAYCHNNVIRRLTLDID